MKADDDCSMSLFQSVTEKAYASFNMHHLKQPLNSSRFLTSSSPIRKEVTEGLVSLHSLYNKYIHYFASGLTQLHILECDVSHHLYQQVMSAKFSALK